MAKRPTWKVDDYLQITLKRSFLGKYRILLNDQEIVGKIGKGRKIPFTLMDGRQAEIFLASSFISMEYELRVEGKLYLSENQMKKIACLKCGQPAKEGDRFCEKCGAEIPDAEIQIKIIKIQGARKTIGYLSAVFFIFGIVMFGIQSNNSEKSLKNLAQYQDDADYPKLINGKQYKVGDLRKEIQAAPVSVLVTNWILAVIMFALYLYAKKSALVAILVATGVYAAVQVFNAILSPITIGQGIAMKILIIVFLINGIRSAMELRKVGE